MKRLCRLDVRSRGALSEGSNEGEFGAERRPLLCFVTVAGAFPFRRNPRRHEFWIGVRRPQHISVGESAVRRLRKSSDKVFHSGNSLIEFGDVGSFGSKEFNENLEAVEAVNEPIEFEKSRLCVWRR